VLDERSDTEVTQGFAERLPVLAFVGSQRPYIARIPAVDMPSEVCVAFFPSRRAVYVKDRLRFCIDEFRDFQLQCAVVYSDELKSYTSYTIWKM
jgi:hypothetical protein